MVLRAKNRRWQELQKDNIPLEKLARHFEAYNRSEGKSPRTVEWYCRVLRFFQKYLDDQGHSTKLGDLTLGVAREFVLYLQSRRKWHNYSCTPPPDGKLAAISVQNYVRGLRAFFSWLHREGYTEEHMLARLAYVERLAKERYSDHVLPRGLALREVLIFCVEVIVRDLANEPAMSRACDYLALLKEGLSCQQISKELGLSREHVSRVYRRKAFELLAEQFLCVIKRNEPKQIASLLALNKMSFGLRCGTNMFNIPPLALRLWRKNKAPSVGG
jgi:hypothetical protein